MSSKIEVERDLLERIATRLERLNAKDEELRAIIVERQPLVGDWEIDHSTDRPILVLKKCSVIEAEDAYYVLDLIRRDREQISNAVERQERLEQ
jgi:hypothetical protein